MFYFTIYIEWHYEYKPFSYFILDSIILQPIGDKHFQAERLRRNSLKHRQQHDECSPFIVYSNIVPPETT